MAVYKVRIAADLQVLLQVKLWTYCICIWNVYCSLHNIGQRCIAYIGMYVGLVSAFLFFLNASRYVPSTCSVCLSSITEHSSFYSYLQHDCFYILEKVCVYLMQFNKIMHGKLAKSVAQYYPKVLLGYKLWHLINISWVVSVAVKCMECRRQASIPPWFWQAAWHRTSQCIYTVYGVCIWERDFANRKKCTWAGQYTKLYKKVPQQTFKPARKKRTNLFLLSGQRRVLVANICGSHITMTRHLW